MKIPYFLALIAMCLSVHAAPEKQLLMTSTKDFGATLVRIPYPVARQDCGGPPATTAPSTTVPTTSGSGAPPSNPSGPPARRGRCVSCEVENFDLVNQYRASNGLNTLGWSRKLTRLAERWSKTMYRTRVFMHSPHNFWENIIFGQGLSTWDNVAQNFFDRWMDSPGHDQNMRLSTHKCMGVGIYGDGNRFYGTQIFSNDCP